MTQTKKEKIKEETRYFFTCPSCGVKSEVGVPTQTIEVDRKNTTAYYSEEK